MNYIRNLVMFKGAGDNFFKVIDNISTTRKYPKNHLLFMHEESADAFYYIKSGWVKLFRQAKNGAESVTDIMTEGHIFGETALFENDIYSYAAQTVTPAEIIKMPLSALKYELQKNNDLAIAMLTHIIAKKRKKDKELEHLHIQNAPQRIGCYLLRLVDSDARQAVTIELPYGKMLLAHYLGMKPETFSRALVKLKEQAGVTVKGACIEIDRLDRLIDFTCHACSDEYPCEGGTCHMVSS